MSDDDSAELSWPESDVQDTRFPSTPKSDRIGSVLGKRSRDDSPSTPIRRNIKLQLDTPPSSRKRLSRHRIETDVSPSKIKTPNFTLELVQQLDHHPDYGTLGKFPKLSSHSSADCERHESKNTTPQTRSTHRR